MLVERVEGLASDAEWQRAYDEINDFEEQLVEAGCLLQKFWLHISREEQAARFEAREQTPYKKYKITDEDYRNRGRWDDYERAVDQMVLRTSTERRAVAPGQRRGQAARPRRGARGDHRGAEEGSARLTRTALGTPTASQTRCSRASWRPRTPRSAWPCSPTGRCRLACGWP